MPKRKASNPSKSVNTGENWALFCNASTSLTESRAAKKSKHGSFNLILSCAKSSQEQYYIGKLQIGTTNNVFPKEWKKAKFEVKEDVIIFTFDKETSLVLHLNQEFENIHDILSLKSCFSFKFETDSESNAYMYIYLSSVPITNFNKKTGNVIQWLFEHFYGTVGVSCDPDDFNRTEVEELYKEIEMVRKKNLDAPSDVQHKNLLPKLRQYQVEAVNWMLCREHISPVEITNPMYICVPLASGKSQVYYNKYSGFLLPEKPTISLGQTGGVLADEMGLGKTIEVLACIFANKRDLPVDNSENTEEDTEEDIDDVPLIEVQARLKRAKARKQQKWSDNATSSSEEDFDDVYYERRISEGKYSLKQAAQKWYERQLNQMSTVRKRKRKDVYSSKAVLCVCGETERKTGLVSCVDCAKRQHADCMGFRGKNTKYFCSQCWTKKPLIKSSATLIVTPSSICKQWLAEVKRHVRKNGLKVLHYTGIHEAGMIYPETLIEYDLVVTSYNVLQSELKFSEENQSKSLRYAKKYDLPSTPLLRVEWWRLCLDEAQAVESPRTAISQMAHEIPAVHRWAITGTPIQTDLSDIYGLVECLKIAPYNDEDTWNNVLYFPYCCGNKVPMHQFLSDILWRSSKASVIDQINIPVQTINEFWLEFCAIEKFFYQREHELSVLDFASKISTFERLDVTLCSIDRRSLKKLMQPLLSLRQACIHPGVTKGRYLGGRRHVNTMEDLLEALIAKNVAECEELLRAVVASLNGIAGVRILQEDYVSAAEAYRSVLQLASKHKQENNVVEVDTLQQIHALHNLAYVLAMDGSDKIPRTLRDDQLAEDCQNLQQKYVQKYMALTKNALHAFRSATDKLLDYKSKFKIKDAAWCLDFLHICSENDWDDELIGRIRSDTTIANMNLKSNFETMIQSVKKISFDLGKWIDTVAQKIVPLRKQITTVLLKLDADNIHIDQKVITGAMECHLRPDKNTKKVKKCLMCTFEDEMKKYECVIFRIIYKKNDKSEGNWMPSLHEAIIRVLYNFACAKNVDVDLLSDGEIHLAYCETLRKEFKEMRRLWVNIDKQIAAQDEIDICKIRFRLKDPTESPKVKGSIVLKALSYNQENKLDTINVIGQYELHYHLSLMENEKSSSEIKLQKLLGTNTYLNALNKKRNSSSDPDSCPICITPITNSCSILQCGHCYCLECIGKLIDSDPSSRYISCCICRQRQLCDDITYVKGSMTEAEADQEAVIKGSYPSKVEAVLRKVLKLRSEDETVKIIIFSTWDGILEAVANALKANSVTYEILLSINKKFEDKLDQFKNLNRTVLLLPIRLGAKGLNIVEATHVIMMEPLMNPGDDLQAIGRVHRIGQTRPTFVHRFLMRNTIEEKIFNAVNANADNWDKNKLTLLQLQELFISSAQ